MPDDATIKTPVGPVKKKTAAFVGVGLAGVAGIVWYRSKQAAAATPAVSTSDTTDTSGDVSSIDPATGYPYGSAEDEAALAQQQGISYSAYGNGTLIGYPTTDQGPGTFTSNGQWAQYAEQYLVDSAGADATTVAAALGKYVTGQPVTSDQQSVIQQAIAFAGYPPVAGPGGNPPGIITSTSTSGGNVTVPNVIGMSPVHARAAIVAAGLVYKETGVKAPHKVVSQSPTAGTKVDKGSTVTVTLGKGKGK